MSANSKDEFLSNYVVHVLPFGATTPRFEKSNVMLDAMLDTATSIKDKLGVRGFVLSNAQIVDEGDVMKNWYLQGTAILVAVCATTFDETDEWMGNSNQLARLLHGGVRVDCALRCLSRAHWQEGFPQFSDAATFLRNVVDSTGTHDYQRRKDLVCLGMPRKELMPVAPFNEHSTDLMLPPILQADPTAGHFVDEWVDRPTNAMSEEEVDLMRSRSTRLRTVAPYLRQASKAVVRIFGYHSVNLDVRLSESRQRVVPFTGFFVSPKHILSTRSAMFDEKNNTFPNSFRFTRNQRAIHGMLRPQVDLFECREVEIIDFLIDSIRNIGVALDGLQIPAPNIAAPWSDWLLLEVTESIGYSNDTQYLLPEIGDRIQKGEELFTVHYSQQPNPEYVEDVFGKRGHNKDYTEDDTRRQFWHYDTKCCSVGNAVEDADDMRRVRHSCSMLPATRGSPLLRGVHVNFDNDAAKLKAMGEPYEDGLECAGTFAGIHTGRATELLERERDNIIQMSTGELARVESLGMNMFNEAAAVDHVCLILLYIRFIQHEITNVDHRLHLHKYLHPFSVLTSRDLLSQCHRKMLKDADDYNEYGMDFYEHQDLDAALAAFREGAKMFSTASIPNLSEYEIDLKNALQTNVSAVVVAKLK